VNHGSNALYVNAGCRCDPCTHAATVAKKRYRMATGAGNDGIPQRPIRRPVEPVRDHVTVLVASGWRLVDIAREIGRSQQAFHSLLWNTRAASGHKTIRRDIAAQILALEPFELVDVDDVLVERLIAGTADWRTLTQEERIEAARRMDRRGYARTDIAAVTHLRGRLLYRHAYAGEVAS
jgi:hypothetical protein